MYVITARDSEELETDILAFGEDDDAIDAALAFSEESRARAYLEASQSADSQVVAEIDPVEFVGWLLELYYNNVQLLIVDADHDQLHEGEPQVAVVIADQLSECAERVAELAKHGQ